MTNIIEVEGLTKDYKQLRALNKLSFQVRQGEILGLLGPNGSGKTTAINCILSLLRFSSGSVKIFGKEMHPNAFDIKRRLGVVFQDVAVFDELTVAQNLEYFTGLYVSDKRERAQMIDAAVKLVGLQDYLKFRPKQLSGGLLRRLNLACGIAHKPDLIFLDEPTVAVDPQSRNNILDGIVTLRDQGATVVYTTHYMEEVEQICDRIIILDKGQIIAQGTIDELKQLSNIEEKVTLQGVELSPELKEKLDSDPQIESVTSRNRMVQLVYRHGQNHVSALIDQLRQAGVSYESIYSERPTLNDVFLQLTGKELRD
ncbi:MAG: ABC transporter ATP-binding protein [Varibaculum cambriense]|uniref:ABC transporter ATP-binding protein n=1 Tax=Varibaculum cambriense TaxID=184870 RepID=UPI0029145941|nr:ABC transporter ATP-binding protein [Varibaculum cambriense]MDU4945592.1 ABC transporter ATP-binding protein [Varibaculum cambriense]